jgi:hypothetical protein
MYSPIIVLHFSIDSTSGEEHLKADGTLDMRYKGSQEAVQQQQQVAAVSSKYPSICL